MIGLLSEADEHHAASVAAIQASGRKGRKLCTIWEVVGEAYTLFRMRIAPARSAEPALAVLRWARESAIQLLQTDESDHQRAAALLERYSQLRLSYVDALLLAVAERQQMEELITVDMRHFGAVKLGHHVAVTRV
ncbi:MAG: PIN domain-containing protein [Candidatus Dormibacteraeota bacterium]|nr:PIN domain-containing protein [Candidatus Dormibacteraeota bacterium]